MSEHLPDCPGDETMCSECGRDWCICEVLRACRERTLDEAKAIITVDAIQQALDSYDEEFFDRSCSHLGGTDSICYDCLHERVVVGLRDAIEALRSDGVSPSNPTA